MKKSDLDNSSLNGSEDEFMLYGADVVNSFDQAELSNAFGLEQSVGEHDPVLFSKDSREELKIPSTSRDNRVYAPMCHYEPNLVQDCEVTPIKRRADATSGVHTTPSDQINTTPEDQRIGSVQKHYCTICHKVYKKKNNLVSHMRKHTGEKPFKCTECGRLFTERSNLNTHMRTHTGQKPYKCLYCQRSFTTKGHLVEHQRLHTGERPYVCKECGKSFRRSTTQKIHMRTHTNEKPFVCPCCGKGFTESGNMKIHLRIHTDEKPFECPLGKCDKKFRTKGNLIEHLKTKRHNQEIQSMVQGKRGDKKEYIKAVIQALLESSKVVPKYAEQKEEAI